MSFPSCVHLLPFGQLSVTAILWHVGCISSSLHVFCGPHCNAFAAWLRTPNGKTPMHKLLLQLFVLQSQLSQSKMMTLFQHEDASEHRFFLSQSFLWSIHLVFIYAACWHHVDSCPFVPFTISFCWATESTLLEPIVTFCCPLGGPAEYLASHEIHDEKILFFSCSFLFSYVLV